jgi:signal transduction histidine kinase
MRQLDKIIDIEIPTLRDGSPRVYLLAFLCASVAISIRAIADPYIVGVSFAACFPALMIASLVGGFAAGMFCVAVSALGTWYFILPPGFSFDPGQLLAVCVFSVLGATNVVLICTMRAAVARYRSLGAELEVRVAERGAELQRTQAMLFQAQKMEALGQLTGGLAHDFNNMIAVVLGNLDIMRRRLAAGKTDVIRYLDNARDGGQRAAHLTQRLLAFARKQPLSPVIVHVNGLVLEMSELLYRTLGENIRLQCLQADGLWKACVDQSQFENAILNLAVNARDAMPDAGTLIIETANVHLDERYAAKRPDVKPGHYVMLAVTDTGTGMSQDVLARAIDPFFTTKEPGKGTGLGLSQVFGFIKQSGGHMAISSEPGGGTTVRLYVPCADGTATEPVADGAPASEETEPAAACAQTVLVVEDDDQVRRMSVAALRELGYRVDEAANGADALTLLNIKPEIDLLFTDVVMPEMDGRRLAETALKRRPALKVLYTTGHARTVIRDGILDPDLDLIAKPFTVDQLARKVRAVLGMA